MRRWFLMAGSVVLSARALGAQSLAHRADIGVRTGEQLFAKGTALERAMVVGVEATWLVRRSATHGTDGPSLRLGGSFDIARPRTNGEQFPLVAIDRGDTTLLYAMALRTTLLQGGAQVRAELPVADARLFGYAGAGLYSLWWKARESGRTRRMTHPMIRYGLGVEDPINRTWSVRLQAGAATFVRFNRDALDASAGWAPSQRVYDAAPAPSAASRTPTNVQFSVGLQFRPGVR